MALILNWVLLFTRVAMIEGAWTCLIIIGVVHTGLMSTLLYSAIQKIPTTLVGALSFIYPIVAICAGH